MYIRVMYFKYVMLCNVHMYVSHRQRFFPPRCKTSAILSDLWPDRIMHYTLALFVESQSQAVRSSGLYISIYIYKYIVDVRSICIRMYHTYVKSSHHVATCKLNCSGNQCICEQRAPFWVWSCFFSRSCINHQIFFLFFFLFILLPPVVRHICMYVYVCICIRMYNTYVDVCMCMYNTCTCRMYVCRSRRPHRKPRRWRLSVDTYVSIMHPNGGEGGRILWKVWMHITTTDTYISVQPHFISYHTLLFYTHYFMYNYIYL